MQQGRRLWGHRQRRFSRKETKSPRLWLNGDERFGGALAMSPREVIANLRQMLPSLLTVVAVIVGAIAVMWFLPGRTAAILLAIIAAALLTFLVLRGLARTTQIALLWLGIGISADAAYARVNDQVPVTVATALVRLVEAIIKLGDIMIRSLGFSIPAGPGRVAAPPAANVAPEFVWAFILALVFFLAFTLIREEE
jgi:hypothetical protein